MEIHIRFLCEMLSPAGFQREPASDEGVINLHKALDIMIVCFLQLL